MVLRKPRLRQAAKRYVALPQHHQGTYTGYKMGFRENYKQSAPLTNFHSACLEKQIHQLVVVQYLVSNDQNYIF